MSVDDPTPESIEDVRHYLSKLQDRICEALASEDGEVDFDETEIRSPSGGYHRPRVLSGGPVLERAAVHFSHSIGATLPPAATGRRPELAGRGYQAVSVSLIVHPRNPYAPTSHANLRYFTAEAPGRAPVWWFGGGFDLTPYYGFEEDATHWHRTARHACAAFGTELYPRLKEWCDRYFYLEHRKEPRGIGGLFFDDLNEGGFERCFALQRSIGDQYLRAYLPILARRKNTPYGERERAFQLMRRGRYVEFNLLYDRGTRFGLESGGRVESILASMPPLVSWHYDWRPEPGSAEEKLLERFLRPRDWLDPEGNASDTL